MIEKSSKIFVAGHRGLAGSAIVRTLRNNGYTAILTAPRQECDLQDVSAVSRFFAVNQPEAVVLAAARVGGILANCSYPADFIYENLQIECNVIRTAYDFGVRRLIFLGSSCIYPRDCPQPIRESYLLSGPLESTNRPYAIAKIAGIELCWSFNRQFGTEYLCLMPTNLYGIGDNYDLSTSHVLPALLRKSYEAKVGLTRSMVVWGSGLPRREFMFSDDLGRACKIFLELDEERLRPLVRDMSHPPLVNVGIGQDMEIAELVRLINKVTGFNGVVAWDSTKPDGTPQKLLDVSMAQSLGWEATTPIEEGLEITYADMLSKLHKA